MDDLLIQQCMNEIRPLFLKKYSEKSLESYFRYLINNKEASGNGRDIIYNFKVSGNEEQRTDFLRAFSSAVKHIIPSFDVKKITEESLLRSHDSMDPLTDTDALAIIANDALPLTRDVDERWGEIADLFIRSPKIVKILLADPDTLKERFHQNEHVYYRVFPCDVVFQTITPEIIIDRVMSELLQSGFNINEDFDREIRAYIAAVYPKAALRGEAFVSDLINRVERLYYERHREGILDAECVPWYRKEKKPREGGTGQKGGVQQLAFSVDTKKYLVLNGDNRDTLPMQSNENKEPGNVLILALSIFNRKTISNNLENEVLSYNGRHYKIDGEYQLEPVPKHLMAELKEEKDQALDWIIAIASSAVEKDLIPDGSGAEINPIDYFSYKIRKFSDEYDLHMPGILILQEKDERPDSAAFLQEVVSAVRLFKNCEIYMDIHGGPRQDQELLSNMLSVLSYEGVRIEPDNIYTIAGPGGKIERGGEGFRILDFVSGVHECVSYARTDSLTNYVNKQSSDEDRKLVRAMTRVANAIQICDITGFEHCLRRLDDQEDGDDIPDLRTCIENVKQEPSDSMMKTFIDIVEKSYEPLLSADSTVLDEIKWCKDKGFYQQALTLCEGRIPEYLHDKNIFQYDEGITGKYSNDSENNRFELNNEIFNKCLCKLKNGAIDILRFNGEDSPDKSIHVELFGPDDKQETINEFLRLHFTLKDFRNNANHAGQESVTVKRVRELLEEYLNIIKKLTHRDSGYCVNLFVSDYEKYIEDIRNVLKLEKQENDAVSNSELVRKGVQSLDTSGYDPAVASLHDSLSSFLSDADLSDPLKENNAKSSNRQEPLKKSEWEAKENEVGQKRWQKIEGDEKFNRYIEKLLDKQDGNNKNPDVFFKVRFDNKITFVQKLVRAIAYHGVSEEDFYDIYTENTEAGE